MKLTDELKGKLESATSQEEAATLLNNARKGAEAAGIILDDADLEQVSGGISGIRSISDAPVIVFKPR